MKTKRIISMLLTLVMLVGMFSTLSITGTAAESLPANTVIVDLSATDASTSATYNGTEYSGLTFGTNLFATIQNAINAANEGDTILLCAGSYSEAVYISKSVNIKGAQAGVTPNLDEAEGAESKKLNPARSLTDATKETFNNGVWYVGYKAADTLADAATVTINIDGVVFNYAGWIQSQIQDVDKDLYLNLKNCIANATGNAFIFTNKENTQYGAQYSRHITIENTRIENVGTRNYTGMFGKLIADEFLLDNVYVAATNKSVQVTNEWLISESENNPKFVVKNSTFHINAQAIMLDMWTQRRPDMSCSLLQKESVTVEIDGNTFIGQASFAVIRPTFTEEGLTNLKVKIKNNTFMNSQKPAVSSNKASNSDPIKNIPSTCYEIDNNTFINCNKDNLISGLWVTSAATATRTLCIVDGAAVAPTDNATVSYASYYKDVNKKVLVATGDKVSIVGVQQKTDGEKVDIRIAGVLNFDDLDAYARVGFKVTIKKNGTTIVDEREISGTSVYSSIVAGGETISAADLASDYIFILAIKNFAKSADYEVEINAYAEDLSGAKYYDNIGMTFTIINGVIEQA